MRIIVFHTDEIPAAALAEALQAAHADIRIDCFRCSESGVDNPPSGGDRSFDPFYHSWTQLGTADLVLNVVNRAIRSDEYCYERYHFGLPGLLLANRHFLGNPFILHVSASGKADSTVDTANMSAHNAWLLSRNKGDELLRREPGVEIVECPLFHARESTPRGLIGRLFGAAQPSPPPYDDEVCEREVASLARCVGDCLLRLSAEHSHIRQEAAAQAIQDAVLADAGPQQGDQKAA